MVAEALEAMAEMLLTFQEPAAAGDIPETGVIPMAAQAAAEGPLATEATVVGRQVVVSS